ncbi:peptidyl-alpha-hydroxyglycine alpha-amidating lyase family protein [Opitutus sp. GAS368]|uniref:peptidyl-alpha-hydroxyglycine alpha-amidating lyase family protein n=1 Tax=Opitutus sp. GAS368 TaxID=1882749 RepID=UPI00087C6781|nr:peptidyl-alpha-hydroxyglycine alpha-amidating lyase family protein [Opitutus sp. GAS368]SDS48203.1 Sugar lactone lactonase YvrE [Opitutus sp. GAS368]
MFPLRAAPFTSSAKSRLVPQPGWARLPGITLDRVVGVGIDSRDRIYVAHRGDRPFLRLRADGSLDCEIGAAHQKKSVAYDLRGPTPIPIAERHWLHGLHVDPRDNVWITDVSRHLVRKFSPEGDLLLTLGVDGEPGCDDRHFFQPTHVCVLPGGEFYVTDGYGNSRIAKFSADGRFLFDWGRRGTAPGEFHTPHVITLGADGLLYMTDRENDRIQVFHPDGTPAANWPGLHSVDGLCAAPDGCLYGSAGIDNAIIRFDRSGRTLEVWTFPDVLHYPHAIAVGKDGSLYIAETGDRWQVTGRLPAERAMLPRTGAEGSALSKFTRVC